MTPDVYWGSFKDKSIIKNFKVKKQHNFDSKKKHPSRSHYSRILQI